MLFFNQDISTTQGLLSQVFMMMRQIQINYIYCAIIWQHLGNGKQKWLEWYRIWGIIPNTYQQQLLLMYTRWSFSDHSQPLWFCSFHQMLHWVWHYFRYTQETEESLHHFLICLHAVFLPHPDTDSCILEIQYNIHKYCQCFNPYAS